MTDEQPIPILTLDTVALRQALADVTRIIRFKTGSPVHTLVRLECDVCGSVRISATSRDKGDNHGDVTAILWGTVARAGVVFLPAGDIQAVAKLATASTVTLRPNAGLIERKAMIVTDADGLEAEIPLREGWAWDLLPRDGAEILSIAEGELKHALRKVCRLASPDHARPGLNGVLLDYGASPYVQATDGFRGRVVSLLHAEVMGDAAGRVILPLRAAHVLTSILGDGHVSVWKTEGETPRMMLAWLDREVVLTVQDTTFQAIADLAPTHATSAIVVDRKALRRFCAVARRYRGPVTAPITLDIEDGRIMAKCQKFLNTDEGGVLVARVGTDGTPVGDRMLCNPHYLLDALSAATSEHVTLIGPSPQGAWAVQSDGDEPGNWYLVMPMFDGERHRERKAAEAAAKAAAERQEAAS